MTLRALCIACRHGHHENHVAVPTAGTPGLIGSRHECPCTGDCADRMPDGYPALGSPVDALIRWSQNNPPLPGDFAFYSLEAEFTFAGPMPERFNKAAPEVNDAVRAAIAAAKAALIEHGFVPVENGYGSKRTSDPR